MFLIYKEFNATDIRRNLIKSLIFKLNKKIIEYTGNNILHTYTQTYTYLDCVLKHYILTGFFFGNG